MLGAPVASDLAAGERIESLLTDLRQCKEIDGILGRGHEPMGAMPGLLAWHSSW